MNSQQRAAEVLAKHSEEWGDTDGNWRCGCGHLLGRDDEGFEDRQRAHQAAALSAADCLRDDREGETVTEWAVRWSDEHDYTEVVSEERAMLAHRQPTTSRAFTRQRTRLPDVVTDWSPVTP